MVHASTAFGGRRSLPPSSVNDTEAHQIGDTGGNEHAPSTRSWVRDDESLALEADAAPRVLGVPMKRDVGGEAARR